ncbi:MAG: hypothetical protein HC889_17600 [Synechococcaceae cyanobacterium SM1_2_3]|nr:hypothetical protein [Synechococcaceae cyanobacterium SM1_2_3]
MAVLAVQRPLLVGISGGEAFDQMVQFDVNGAPGFILPVELLLQRPASLAGPRDFQQCLPPLVHLLPAPPAFFLNAAQSRASFGLSFVRKNGLGLCADHHPLVVELV